MVKINSKRNTNDNYSIVTKKSAAFDLLVKLYTNLKISTNFYDKMDQKHQIKRLKSVYIKNSNNKLFKKFYNENQYGMCKVKYWDTNTITISLFYDIIQSNYIEFEDKTDIYWNFILYFKKWLDDNNYDENGLINYLINKKCFFYKIGQFIRNTVCDYHKFTPHQKLIYKKVENKLNTWGLNTFHHFNSNRQHKMIHLLIDGYVRQLMNKNFMIGAIISFKI